jgi:hypothetical protein
MSRKAQRALKLFRIVYVVYVVYKKVDFDDFSRGFQSRLLPMISLGTRPPREGGRNYES